VYVLRCVKAIALPPPCCCFDSRNGVWVWLTTRPQRLDASVPSASVAIVVPDDGSSGIISTSSATTSPLSSNVGSTNNDGNNNNNSNYMTTTATTTTNADDNSSTLSTSSSTSSSSSIVVLSEDVKPFDPTMDYNFFETENDDRTLFLDNEEDEWSDDDSAGYFFTLVDGMLVLFELLHMMPVY
jgi:hypothetical protein